MSLKLYYSPGACSLAPHIALEETGAEFEPVLVKLADGAQRAPEYLAVNPKGRVPALADDGFVVTENPAILRYIAIKHPGVALWPAAPADEARCLEWLAWCASTIHVAYAHVRRPERYATSDVAKADVVERGRETCRDVWRQVETRFAASSLDWAAGADYSVADPYIFTFWTWGRAATLGYDMPRDFPAWTAHAERMGARPAVQRALAREGLARP